MRLGKPTTAQPGTAEKIELMRKRLERGQELFHPLDPRHEHAYNEPKSDTVSLSAILDALSDHLHQTQDGPDCE